MVKQIKKRIIQVLRVWDMWYMCVHLSIHVHVMKV